MQGSPTKGGARKKNQQGGARKNDDSSSENDDSSSDDDVEIIRIKKKKVVNTNLFSDFDDSDSSSDDEIMRTEESVVNTDVLDFSDDDDSDNYEPTEDEEEDDDDNDSLRSLSSNLSSNLSSSVSSSGEDDNSNSPPIATMKEAAQSKKKKSLGANAPKLTSAFAGLGFYNKASVAKYDINGSDISFVSNMNVKEPIIPISDEALDLKERMNSLCKIYRAQIKAAGNDTTQWRTEESIALEIANLGQALKETLEVSNQVEENIKIAKDNRRLVESARLMAQRSIDHWAPIDVKKLVEWKRVHYKTCLLLKLCDKDKKDQEFGKMKMKMKAGAAAAAKEKAASKTKAKADEVINMEESPLVMTADGSMQKVSECITLPPAATSPRATKMNKGMGKDKKPKVPVTHAQFKMQINGGRFGTGKQLHDHGFELDKFGVIRCTLCPQVIGLAKNMKRHTEESVKHKTQFQKKLDGDVKLHHQSIRSITKGAKGSEMHEDLKAYRFKALIAAAKYNVSTEAMAGLCKDFIDEYAGETFADTSDAVSLIATPLLGTLQLRNRQILSGNGVYDEFGVTFDGTPSFEEAEAIIVRVVTKDWEILEILVRCGLYERKLSATELSSHIIEAITVRAGLHLNNWMSTHQDRAKVNVTALKIICAEFPEANPAKGFCCTHTISNSGKKAIGNNGSASFAELFRKSWQFVINTPGKARGRYAELFGSAPTTAGGVRFFVKYEQIAELFEATPESIMKIVAWCVEHKVSDLSAKNMMLRFNPETEAQAALAMAIVEIAAVAEGVRTFAEACYTLEGDSCLILRALSVFKRMELYIKNGYSTPRLESAVERALPFLQRVESGYIGRVQKADTVVTMAGRKVAATQAELTRLNDLKTQVQGGTSSRGRMRTATVHNRDNDQLDRILEELVEARVQQRNSKAEEKKAKDLAGKVVASYEDWKKKFPHRTKPALMGHGKDKLLPVGQYYHKQFTEEDGDCHQTRVLSEAAQIFDPIFLSKQSTADIVTVLHDLADKLLVYECRHIDESFIKKLKKEMHKLVNDAKGDHDLDRIPSTRQYQTRMQKRIKRHKLAKDTILDWKNDAGEYAERIWKWWKHRKEKYPYHGVAIRLIAYAQLSSCSVERVFSKLEKIVKVTSDTLKEDMCEVRLLLQVNGDLDEMYNALVVNFGEE